MENQITKTCKKCENTQLLTDFHKDAKSKYGVMSVCKNCRNHPKPKFVSHPENEKPCWKCKEVKPVSEFGVDNSRFDKLSPRCKTCLRNALKESAKRHPETTKRKWAKRYSRDSKKIKQRITNQQIQRIKTQNYIVRSEKKCRVCQTIKPISDFTRHARTADGYRFECSDCRKAFRKTEHYKQLQRTYKHRRRAREHNAEGFYTIRDIKRLYREQNGCCVYCGLELENYHVDHIIPLARGGSNWASNLQLLCQLCNLRKNAKTPDEFFSIYPREILQMINKKAAA